MTPEGGTIERMAGPLAGTRIVELQGRSPGPFGAMLLAGRGTFVDPGGVVRQAAP